MSRRWMSKNSQPSPLLSRIACWMSLTFIVVSRCFLVAVAESPGACRPMIAAGPDAGKHGVQRRGPIPRAGRFPWYNWWA